MKKVMFFLLLVVAGIGIYFSFFSSQVQVTEVISVNTIENLEDAFIEEPQLEELIEEKEENLSVDDIDKALELEKDLDVPEEVEPEMVAETKDIMVETSMEEVVKNFAPKEGIKPVAAIELPKNSISKLNIGDTILLPNMGNGEFEAKITNKKEHKNGSVTVTGNLVDTGNQYSVVLTEGKNMSFGTVTTPNGSYEIEVKDGQGYVYSTDAIDREWIDHSQSDTLSPHK
jgi:hypothetical protein